MVLDSPLYSWKSYHSIRVPWVVGGARRRTGEGGRRACGPAAPGAARARARGPAATGAARRPCGNPPPAAACPLRQRAALTQAQPGEDKRVLPLGEGALAEAVARGRAGRARRGAAVVAVAVGRHAAARRVTGGKNEALGAPHSNGAVYGANGGRPASRERHALGCNDLARPLSLGRGGMGCQGPSASAERASRALPAPGARG
jgi:hypothetical protein